MTEKDCNLGPSGFAAADDARGPKKCVNWKYEEAIDEWCENVFMSRCSLSEAFENLWALAKQDAGWLADVGRLEVEDYSKARLLSAAIGHGLYDRLTPIIPL